MNKLFFNSLLLSMLLFLNISYSSAQMLNEAFYVKQYEDQKDACIKKRDYKCAEEALTNMIQMRPKAIDNYTELGMVNYCLGNYQEAIGLFKRAIDLSHSPEALYYDRDLADAHMFLGITYHTLGKESEAREELNKALEYFEKEATLDDIIYVDVFLKEINKNTSK